MKRTVVSALLALCCAAGYSQTLVHPFGGADGGGGRASGGGFTLLGSAGQAAAGVTANVDTGIGIEGGLIPPLREGSGATHTAGVLVQSAWNMISIPVIPPDPTKTVLIPSAVSSAFVYLPPPTGYVSEDTLLPGTGFWAKFPGVATLTFTGTGITLDTVVVNAGWNLIGSLTWPLLTSDIVPLGGVSVLSSYFAFLGGFGYTSEDTLEPGRAYWVKVSQPGSLVLRSGSVLMEPAAGPPSAGGTTVETPAGSRRAVNIPEGTGTISFRDASGQSRELYVAGAGAGIAPEMYELPPPPPGGLLDVRYGSQKILETFGAGGAAEKGVSVLISGAQWPMEIGYSGGREGSSVIVSIRSAQGVREHDLSGGEALTLEGPALVSVQSGKAAGTDASIPAEYRLYQNHPNPFNPSTKVTFDLPEAGKVTLLITNSLGQEVMKVLDGELEAGRHIVGIDGNALPTGVYFYRLTAGNFSDAKKMLLLK